MSRERFAQWRGSNGVGGSDIPRVRGRFFLLATAGFSAASSIAAGALASYGVRNGLRWAWITGVIVPVVGLAVALSMHYIGHFTYGWVSHLGAIYVGTIIYVVGATVALSGLSQAAPSAAQAAAQRLREGQPSANGWCM